MLHKRSQLLLICGLVLSLGVLTACSSPEAVQANAPVMSSEVSSRDPNSGVSSSSSEIVSSSASPVSSVPSSGVTSSPSSGTNSTALQAPATSKPSSGTVSMKPASTKPASTKPASTAPKPASKPTSTAPTPKPTSTAPVETGVNAKYYGANYGCSDKGQYSYVLEKAAAVTSSSRYSKSMSFNEGHQDIFEQQTGVSYSDSANQVVSIITSINATGGSSSSSTGSAYNYFTGSSRVCSDIAKAEQAALHEAGYNCKLYWGKTGSGTPHMWIGVEFDGAWHEWGDARFSNGTPAGYSASGSGYNY